VQAYVRERPLLAFTLLPSSATRPTRHRPIGARIAADYGGPQDCGEHAVGLALFRHDDKLRGRRRQENVEAPNVPSGTAGTANPPTDVMPTVGVIESARLGYLNRHSNDFDVFRLEHGVEAAGELAIMIAEQESAPVPSVRRANGLSLDVTKTPKPASAAGAKKDLNPRALGSESMSPPNAQLGARLWHHTFRLRRVRDRRTRAELRAAFLCANLDLTLEPREHTPAYVAAAGCAEGPTAARSAPGPARAARRGLHP
jgi:hypothetical protein